MSLPKSDYIWMNGQLVKWDDAKIHVLSHVIHYGSAVFEGMRVYKTNDGPKCFRLHEHIERLFNSAKIYQMEIPFTVDEIENAILNLVSTNNLEECYVRPIVYRGYGTLGVDPTGIPIDVAIGVWPWGKYLGEGALEKGVDVGFSSWNRIAPNTMPAMAKCAANYMNSQLIKLEALRHGYAEGIALDVSGHVSEGSGENIFMVRRGALITPTFTASILPGITRRTVIQLATDMGLKVIEQNIPREALYLAQEVFFTGSAAEITPISSIDGIKVGSGSCGEITKRIQDAFFDVIRGKVEDRYGWMTPIPKKSQVTV
ncbi:MAG: branched-chain amino acid transaminase [candidate division Zixibacteria bacterium]|nr:branched-chain amino acid transaminase [candidate division Zixibacteria bacterium]